MNISININYVIRLLTTICIFFYCTKVQAQFTDRIIKKDSTELYVMVEDTEGDSIIYRFYGQPKDSFYALPKSAVSKIVLKNKGGNYYPTPVSYYADGTIKPAKFSPIYVDMALGFLLSDEIYGLADLNIGYRFNEKQAIGISYIGMSDYSINATGIGVQARFTPRRKSLFKVELGVITSASSIDRSGPEIYTHLPKNSVNAYIRIGAAVRFGSIFTLGINYIGSGSIIFDISKKVNGQTVSSNKTWSGSMGFLCPQFGITIPSMLKKRKN